MWQEYSNNKFLWFKTLNCQLSINSQYVVQNITHWKREQVEIQGAQHKAYIKEIRLCGYLKTLMLVPSD